MIRISKNCALIVDEDGIEKEVPLEYDSNLIAIDPNNP